MSLSFTRQEAINYRLLSQQYKNTNPLNRPNIQRSCTFQHEIIKCAICYILKKNKKKFCIEAIFTNNYRADVLNLSDGMVYEVLHSEKEEYYENKRVNYPEGLDIIKIHTKDFLGKNLEEIHTQLQKSLFL